MFRYKRCLLWFFPFLFACQLSGLVELPPTAVISPTLLPTPEILQPASGFVNPAVISNDPLNGRFVSLAELPPNYVQLAPFDPQPVILPAVVPAYTPDFAQTANLGQFDLSEPEATKLMQTGYLLRPEQMAFNGAELFSAGVPATLTVDLVMLRTQAVQKQVLHSTWDGFTQKQTHDAIAELIIESQKQLVTANDPLTQRAAENNLAIFSVAGKFYDPAWPIPVEVQEMVTTEFALFEMDDELLSPLLGKRVRYSTILNDPLPHMRVYMWLLAAAPHIDVAQSPAAQRLAGRQVELLLDIWLAGSAPAWQDLYFQQQFRQGAVSPSVEDWVVLNQSGGTGDDLIASVTQFESAKFELLPAQRPFTQRVFDELVFNRVGVYEAVELSPVTALNTEAGVIRATPRLIDLAAALGSDAALETLVQEGEADFVGWEPQMADLRARTSQTGGTLATHQQNVLTAIQPLAEPMNGVYPIYMRSSSGDRFDQWMTGLVIALNPLLQAGEAPVEWGGADQLVFVEPRPEIYANLAAQTRQLAESLIRLNRLDETNAERLLGLERELLMLKAIAEKGLAGGRPTADETEMLKRFLTDAAGVQLADFVPVFSGPQGQLTIQIKGWAPALFVVLDGDQQTVAQGVRLQTNIIRQNN